MAFSPASRVRDYLVFGEFGDVNPSITDSSTYPRLSPERMEEWVEHEAEGCFLYSRHFNPTNNYAASALQRTEDGESAQVMASGMGAIAPTPPMTLMQRDKLGSLAVSLGYFKTPFNTPGHSTSSEIPPAEREAAGLREGLIRCSIGPDEAIAPTTERIENCRREAEVHGSL